MSNRHYIFFGTEGAINFIIIIIFIYFPCGTMLQIVVKLWSHTDFDLLQSHKLWRQVISYPHTLMSHPTIYVTHYLIFTYGNLIACMPYCLPCRVCLSLQYRSIISCIFRIYFVYPQIRLYVVYKKLLRKYIVRSIRN